MTPREISTAVRRALMAAEEEFRRANVDEHIANGFADDDPRKAPRLKQVESRRATIAWLVQEARELDPTHRAPYWRRAIVV